MAFLAQADGRATTPWKSTARATRARAGHRIAPTRGGGNPPLPRAASRPVLEKRDRLCYKNRARGGEPAVGEREVVAWPRSPDRPGRRPGRSGDPALEDVAREAEAERSSISRASCADCAGSALAAVGADGQRRYERLLRLRRPSAQAGLSRERGAPQPSSPRRRESSARSGAARHPTGFGPLIGSARSRRGSPTGKSESRCPPRRCPTPARHDPARRAP